MQGIDEIIQRPEILRFESSNKNLLAQYVLLQDGVIMCYAYGYVDIQSLKEGNTHLLSLLEQLKQQKRPQPPDMIIDFNNIRWIDKSARSFLNKSFSNLFKEDVLQHVGIISDNSIVRTMGGLWSRMSPWMDFAFYKSEINAYQEILKKRVDSAKKSSEDTIADDILKENIIFYRGMKLLLYKKKEWQCIAPDGNLAITLINSKILHIIMGGTLSSQLADHTKNCIGEAHNLLNHEPLALIFELSQITFPSVNERKYWLKKIQEIGNCWERTFVIASAKLAPVFRIEATSSPEIVKRIELEVSVANAMDKVFFTDTKSRNNGRAMDEAYYDSYSKKELIEEVHRLKKDQSDRIDHLLGLLGRMSWDSDFKPIPLESEENDSFCEFTNCLDVIRHDFFGLVQELKKKNQSLETKVNEKTCLLNAKNDELSQLNDELDHFVYCVSHDLRAPLSSIQGLLNLMKMEGEEANQDQYLDLISKNISRLDLFIQEILQLSGNARLSINKKTIDFQKIIDNTFSELVYLMESKGIQKSIYIEQETIFVNDPQRIVIIFRNLLSNAIKYSVIHNDLPEINIKVKVGKDKAFLEISDNGMGIMKEHLDKVFDMFYRATDTNAGSGLGLYIVKQVVNKLNGDISLSSEVGKGTRMVIELPNMV
jgi:signal transduction histidine kinase